MLVNISKKEKAVELRKNGNTYSEILKALPYSFTNTLPKVFPSGVPNIR